MSGAHRQRRGMALLAALVLLALSAALATASFSAARAMRRGAATSRARARVETGVLRAFAEVLTQWSPALDSVPIGTGMSVALQGEPASAGPPLVRSARVDRVADGLYALTVQLLAYDSIRPVARRRARLWLERPGAVVPPQDSLPRLMSPPSVVTPWGFVDLY